VHELRQGFEDPGRRLTRRAMMVQEAVEAEEVVAVGEVGAEEGVVP
jgi:hypothetical protein